MNQVNKLAAIVAMAFAVIALPSMADSPAAYNRCIACHGKAGEGNAALNSPALAGQQAAYLARQLTQFRDGQRGAAAGDTFGAQMRAMATGLSDTDIDEIASYLAALPAIDYAPDQSADSVNDPAVLRVGSDYYQAKCGACHGGNAQGNEALDSPNLAILDTAYLQRQVEHFQNGVRGSAEGDRLGRQMQLMANTVTDADQLRAILLFIAAQPTP